ncbi:MAG: single-stranded DNA-binding protein, partial [Candidatus Cloacimonetes bacterium]|nr:single-stranded DNA-binding protein [Candidatus Cloacimonadota bacterium]
IEDKAEKGSPVLIEGNLKLNQWENNEGKTISKVLIRADKIHVLEHEKK